jgi:hypothetical protein
MTQAVLLRAQPIAQEETVDEFLARGGKITHCPGPGERGLAPVDAAPKRKGRPAPLRLTKTPPRPRPRA